jgi:phosphatidylglycerophosphate synthase
MLDAMMRKLIDPPLARAAGTLARAGVSADAMTGVGLVAGLACAVCIAAGSFGLAMVLLAASRVCDGLDGAIARINGRTARGGFLDIVCDFVFYGAVPLAFALRDPGHAALPAAILLFSFYVNGATFLAFAAIAASRSMETTARGVKSLYFTAGLAEGTETIAAFALMILFPVAFAPLALAFSVLCLLSAAARAWLAWTTFSSGA